MTSRHWDASQRSDGALNRRSQQRFLMSTFSDWTLAASESKAQAPTAQQKRRRCSYLVQQARRSCCTDQEAKSIPTRSITTKSLIPGSGRGLRDQVRKAAQFCGTVTVQGSAFRPKCPSFPSNLQVFEPELCIAIVLAPSTTITMVLFGSVCHRLDRRHDAV